MLDCVLIVGLGSIGRRHARLLREVVPGVEIVALRHRDCRGTEALGVDHCVTSLDEALEFQPRAAVIANPAPYHMELARPLAKAGVHLLIEKPIADTSHGVPELIGICRVRGLVLMVGYNLRFMPSLRRFRELIHSGAVGRVLSVRSEVGQYLPCWRPDTDYRQTVSGREALGGGVLLELSHEIDYLRWLCGEVEWVSAVQRKQSSLEIDVEDTAHLVLGFAAEPGAAAVVAVVSMDFVRHDSTRVCTVIGETGTLRWDAIAGTVKLFKQSATAWYTVFEQPNNMDESYLAEWRHFLGCVSDGEAPSITGEDGLQVLRVIEAARVSSSLGAIAPVVGITEGAGAPR